MLKYHLRTVTGRSKFGDVWMFDYFSTRTGFRLCWTVGKVASVAEGKLQYDLGEVEGQRPMIQELFFFF